MTGQGQTQRRCLVYQLRTKTKGHIKEIKQDKRNRQEEDKPDTQVKKAIVVLVIVLSARSQQPQDKKV